MNARDFFYSGLVVHDVADTLGELSPKSIDVIGLNNSLNCVTRLSTALTDDELAATIAPLPSTCADVVEEWCDATSCERHSGRPTHRQIVGDPEHRPAAQFGARSFGASPSDRSRSCPPI